MHEATFYIGFLWTAVLFGVSVVWLVRAASPLKRILILDTLTLILIAFLALFSGWAQSSFYLDAALLLALLAFVGTLAAVRYQQRERLFS